MGRVPLKLCRRGLTRTGPRFPDELGGDFDPKWRKATEDWLVLEGAGAGAADFDV